MVAFAQPLSRSNSSGNAPSCARLRPRIRKYPYPRFSRARLGLRFYSPALGRWISRDPIGEEGGEHLYACCVNRPADMVDPLGEQALTNPSVIRNQIMSAIVKQVDYIVDRISVNVCCFAACGTMAMIPGGFDLMAATTKLVDEKNVLVKLGDDMILSAPRSNFSTLRWLKRLSGRLAMVGKALGAVGNAITLIEGTECFKDCRKCPEKYGCEPSEMVVN